MKWLLITNDNDSDFQKNFSEILSSFDKKNKLTFCDFDCENIKKTLKKCEDFASCFILSKPNSEFSEENALLFCTLLGFFEAKNITIFSNLVFINENKLFDKNIIKFSDIGDLTQVLKKNYKKISENAVKRLAKNKLLERGIPFTSDCFATYIAKNKIEVVNEFLEAGMSINEKDDAGVPMLNIACRNDNFDFVKMFLELGANIDAVSDDRGYTAVMDAVWRGNEKITKFLIENGADLNTISKEGQSNLVLAVGAGRENIVKLLAENGSDCDVKDMMGMSAYNYAVLFKKTRIVDILKPFHKE